MTHIFSKGSLYQHLMIDGGNLDRGGVDLRQLAGLIVKNYIVKTLPVLDPIISQFIKTEILHGVTDPLPDIRNTSGTILGKIVSSNNIQTWIDILPPLINLLDVISHRQTHITEGALIAIKIIFEDNNAKLQDIGSTIVDTIIARLLSLLEFQESSSIRLYSLESMNALLFQLATESAGSIHIPNFLNSIAKLAADPVPQIRKGVCQAITTLASIEPSTLQSYLPSVCEFMVKAICDLDDNVAIESCEFWFVIIENVDFQGVMIQYFHELIPNLISRLRLKEEQMLQERADEIAEATGEKAVILKPRHHRNKFDAQEEEDVTSNYTLRKRAALLLDNIGETFNYQIIIQPAIQATLLLLSRTDDSNEAIWDHESGTLALGAMSTCFLHMNEQLPQVFSLFLQHLTSTTPELRSITCWAIGRFCEWLFTEGNEDSKVELFRQCVLGLSSCMLDQNPRVQSASCSALSSLIEVAGEEITQHGTHILQCCNLAFTSYGVKNTLVLFDTIGILADNASILFNDNSLVSLYMPHIMRNLSISEDHDMRITPLLECLTSLTPAMKSNIFPYAQNIYIRCLTIINKTLNLDVDEDDDIPKDITICCLDVISGMCEGMDDNFMSLVNATNSSNALLLNLFKSLDDEVADVRQSGFSLAGELSKISANHENVFDITMMHALTAKCLLNLDTDYQEVCNNAVWTLGQIAAFSRYLPNDVQIIQKLIEIVRNEENTPKLHENVSITLGRIAQKDPNSISPYLNDFFDHWCFYLKELESSDERHEAYLGLVSAVKVNSHILLTIPEDNTIINSNAFHFVLACLVWDIEVPGPQKKPLSDLIPILKFISNYGNLWNSIRQNLKEDDRVKLEKIQSLQ